MSSENGAVMRSITFKRYRQLLFFLRRSNQCHHHLLDVLYISCNFSCHTVWFPVTYKCCPLILSPPTATLDTTVLSAILINACISPFLFMIHNFPPGHVVTMYSSFSLAIPSTHPVLPNGPIGTCRDLLFFLMLFSVHSSFNLILPPFSTENTFTLNSPSIQSEINIRFLSNSKSPFGLFIDLSNNSTEDDPSNLTR